MNKNINCQDSALKSLKIVNRELLNSWVIAQLLPNMQRLTVASFHSRSHAEGYVRSLRQLIPDADFIVVFDCQHDDNLI